MPATAKFSTVQYTHILTISQSMLADFYRQDQVHVALEQRNQLLARRNANFANDSPARTHHHLLELQNGVE